MSGPTKDWHPTGELCLIRVQTPQHIAMSPRLVYQSGPSMYLFAINLVIK